VCVDWPEYELTGGLPEGGTYGGDYVSDGMFHPAEAGLGDHIITYAYTNAAGCESIVEQTITVESCVGITEVSEDGIQIFPNPARDMVKLTSAAELISIKVFNNLGQAVIEKTVNGNSYQLNTSDLESGLYFIRLETENNSIIKQLIIE
ncbi:MAG: T9SS type A sorting domain-containing protein, partial [Bacteroidales bacterium]|nr:T9SS type A sorting domain-containing protein [Bacteroidales bacterium]